MHQVRFHPARPFPCQFGERGRHPRSLNQRMTDIDVELERDRKLVVHQTSGNEYALRIAQTEVAMAHRIVTERDVVSIGDQCFFPMAHSQGYEIVCLSVECCCCRAGYG